MPNEIRRLETVVALAKQRGFIWPGSEIYGGLANSWDYGPLGVELKNNIQQEWWRFFVHRRPDMLGLDAAIIMNPKVWEASGHIQNFTDPLVECTNCHHRFRADLIDNDCPDCGGKIGEARQFNLLFKTFIGPVEEKSALAYLRGEIAQAMFVNFKQVQQTMRRRLPFGIAAQGKVFRNEITPGNFIFRTREFNLMEFEYFVRADSWQQHFDYWLTEMQRWLKHLGVAKERIYLHDIPLEELAHYSKRTIDIEYDYPFGRKELYGLAYRTDFDLSNHQAKSGQDLTYTDPETDEKWLPHVIEPTFGLDRSVLVALLEAYHIESAPTSKAGASEERVVMKFPKWLAPYKAAVLPLSKQEPLTTLAQDIWRQLREADIVTDYDETQSIGKRYRRQDEIGTPFCVTVDFESLTDGAVTVRDRDTMQQERIAGAKVGDYISKQLKT